jgi:hypothetical protein
VQIRHHLLRLSRDVVAADELAISIDRVLATDVDGRRARRHDRDVREGGRLNESLWTEQ